ncbi:MAG: hypothetical protein JNM27_21310 [Leptospirales bacterium]|nr:hypothetical protein [Leptospirales bacterium]
MEILDLLNANVNARSTKGLLRTLAPLEFERLDYPTENIPPENFLSNENLGVEIRHTDVGIIEVIVLFLPQCKGVLPRTLTPESGPAECLQKLGPATSTRPPGTVPVLGAFGLGLGFQMSNHYLHLEFTPDEILSRITLSVGAPAVK